jgi:hypothetical protein
MHAAGSVGNNPLETDTHKLQHHKGRVPIGAYLAQPSSTIGQAVGAATGGGGPARIACAWWQLRAQMKRHNSEEAMLKPMAYMWGHDARW